MHGKPAAQPFAAFDIEPAAHRIDQFARFECADAKTARLGRYKRRKQAVTHEIGAHSGPAVDHFDQSPLAIVIAVHAGVEKHAQRIVGSIERVLHQMAEHLIEDFARRQHPARVHIDRKDLFAADRRIGPRGHRAHDFASIGRFADRYRTRAIPRQARDQRVKFICSIAQRNQHVAAKRRVIGMALGIARQ